MTEKPKVVVDVVSDTVCPWCYIGKKRLEKAMNKYKDRLDFEVHWLPYFLNPGASEEGVNKVQMYNDKFGPARVAQMVPQMTATFAEEGLQYSMGGMTGSTRNSHRLLTWAGEHLGPEAQNQLAEELFNGYFTKERFINDKAFLMAAAEGAGVPAKEAQGVLDGGDLATEQLLAQEMKRYTGITGVPHFIINGKYRLGGAQPPEVFGDVFDQLLTSE